VGGVLRLDACSVWTNARRQNEEKDHEVDLLYFNEADAASPRGCAALLKFEFAVRAKRTAILH
jgi:hypothetical protein